MFRIASAAALLVAAAAVAAPVPKEVKKKEVKLDGRWEVVEYHSNGNKVNSAFTITWVIDGQNLTIERSNPKGGGALGRPVGITYSLVKPDGGSANALDYTYTYTNNANPPRIMPGVFEQDGDTLKFCWTITPSGERPAKCEPAQGTILYVFKRVDAK
jgi:uncharacterized protein (TIGR03067 family)